MTFDLVDHCSGCNGSLVLSAPSTESTVFVSDDLHHNGRVLCPSREWSHARVLSGTSSGQKDPFYQRTVMTRTLRLLEPRLPRCKQHVFVTEGPIISHL